MLMSLKRSLESMIWSTDYSKHYFPQVFGSIVFFQWIASYVSPQLSGYLPAYQNFTVERKTEWNAKVTSLVHALIVSAGCLYVVFADEEPNNDKLWGESWISRMNIAVATGYLLSDLTLICMYPESVGGDWRFVFHHGCAIYAYYYVLVFGVLSYYANFRLLAEISTPFVNIRWFLDVCERKRSKMYVLNGILLTISFFVGRIMVMPHYYYNVYISLGTAGFQRLGFVIQASWVITCIGLDAMNIYWFWRILAGVIKLTRRTTVQTEEETKKKVKST